MYDYFKGVLTSKNFPYCSVEVNGIGYRFLINNRIMTQLGELNSEITIYSKLIHKEDSMILCGFLKRQERIIFDTLTSVSGIGTKAALALLDEFDLNELVDAVISEDFKKISRTKGIGAKMAQKIVLELKDKLSKPEITSDIISSDIKNTKISQDTISQTVVILNSLGYNKNEYEKALETVSNSIEKDDVQELLKEVLKMLSVF